MSVALQASLLDGLIEESPEVLPGDAARGVPVPGSEAAPALRPLGGHVDRTVLTSGAWVEHRPSWVAGSDALFERLVQVVPWRAERRRMYEHDVDVPRLLCFYDQDDELPHPLLAEAGSALSAHYRDELGEPFTTAGCCYYRDGRDSVAWHGDRIGRSRSADTMVAIVSFGDPRKLCLRPRGGGSSIAVEMGHGDLLVMGGSCQRTWEHCVPKVAPAGPQISVQFRRRNVF